MPLTELTLIEWLANKAESERGWYVKQLRNLNWLYDYVEALESYLDQEKIDWAVEEANMKHKKEH